MPAQRNGAAVQNGSTIWKGLEGSLIWYVLPNEWDVATKARCEMQDVRVGAEFVHLSNLISGTEIHSQVIVKIE